MLKDSYVNQVMIGFHNKKIYNPNVWTTKILSTFVMDSNVSRIHDVYQNVKPNLNVWSVKHESCKVHQGLLNLNKKKFFFYVYAKCKVQYTILEKISILSFINKFPQLCKKNYPLLCLPKKSSPLLSHTLEKIWC